MGFNRSIALGLILSLLLLALGVAAILTLAFFGQGSVADTSIADAASIVERTLFSLRSAFIIASLSVIASLVVAVPASLALARRGHWFFMRPLVAIISLAMILPTTVAALGLLSVWGQQGLAASIYGVLLGDRLPFRLYGLHGVVLAHMMLNVPLMIRVFMPLLNAVPAYHWRLSALLGLSAWARFRHIEWQAIKPMVANICTLVFLLCFTSFALVLMLGGGPRVTTLEVEIYALVRFDFNLAAAAALSIVQFICAALVVMVLAWITARNPKSDSAVIAGGFRPPQLQMRRHLRQSDAIFDGLVMALLILLVALPMAMVAIKGFNSNIITLINRPIFWQCLKLSVLIASISAGLTLLLSFVIANAKANLTLSLDKNNSSQIAKGLLAIIDAGVMLYLVIPSIVLGTAAFIALRHYGDVFSYGVLVVLAANVLLSLPFALRLIEGRLTSVLAAQNRLAALLGIAGWRRLHRLTLPPLRRDLGTVAGITAALSVGDLGVIVLFSSQDFQTLPWLLYQLSGRYAAGEAASLALLLLLLTIALLGFWRGLCLLLIGGGNARN